MYEEMMYGAGALRGALLFLGIAIALVIVTALIESIQDRRKK